MTEQTKHYLIIGGGLVVAVAVAIVVYKKYEANSGADQAAADQQNQDALAFLEASSLDDPYAVGGAGGSTISLAPAGTSESLAQEITDLESAFGLTPPAAPGGSSSSSGSGGSSSGSGSGSAPAPSVPVGPTPAAPAPSHTQIGIAMEETPTLQLESGELV